MTTPQTIPQTAPLTNAQASPARDDAILAVTADLLTERGWERLTMRTVAERAGVSLSTIYDRWPTKTELAIAAVKFATLSRDQTLETIRELLSDRPNLVLCLLSIQRSDRAYRDVIRDEFAEPMLGPLRDAMLALHDDMLDRETVSLLAMIGPALLFARAVLLEQPMTAEDMPRLTTIVDRLATILSAEQREQVGPAQ